MKKKKTTRKIKIICESAVWSHIDQPKLVASYLSYKNVYWKQGKHRKERHTYQVGTMQGNYFYTGFTPRVIDYLERKGYSIEIESRITKSGPIIQKPKLKGIRFRKDQKQALETILNERRGIWKAPTGSGKTILIAGVVAAVYPAPVVILVHTRTLFEQTIEEMKRFFDSKEIGYVGRGDVKIKKITIAMRQTLVRRIRQVGTPQWLCVIVDEAHHVSGLNSEYATLLEWIDAPMRVGFTATTYGEDSTQLFISEALLGPVLGETKYEELSQRKILAKPRLRFLRMPRRRYTEDYFSNYIDAVVNNRKRNLMIVEEAHRLIQDNRSVLIMVERLDHGETLLRLCNIKMPGTFVLLDGTTSPEIMAKELSAFREQKRLGVIASRVWGEGLNVKTIGAVINAVGGKSEIASIQRFGRGLRKTKGKKDVILVDIIDTDHKHLQEHSLYRICFYSEVGWI